jgi:RNA polymerase sigma factor (sigma-70 family)
VAPRLTSPRRTAKSRASVEFVAVYERSYAGLVRLAYLLTSDAEAARDIVQDCFVNAHQRWDTIDRPDAYLRRSVANGASKTRRDRAHRADRVTRLTQEIRSDAELPGPEYLIDLIQSLPYKQRAVVVLRFYLDLHIDEIADSLGMRTGSVGPTLHRALKHLRKELDHGAS